jgi:hypothetical protein
MMLVRQVLALADFKARLDLHLRIGDASHASGRRSAILTSHNRQPYVLARAKLTRRDTDHDVA